MPQGLAGANSSAVRLKNGNGKRRLQSLRVRNQPGVGVLSPACRLKNGPQMRTLPPNSRRTCKRGEAATNLCEAPVPQLERLTIPASTKAYLAKCTNRSVQSGTCF